MGFSTYTQNAPVVYGAGAIALLGEKVKEFGASKVMCVYDAGVKMAGIGEKAEASLREAGIDYIVYDKVAADPPDAMLDEMGDIAREAGIDCVVGVGGGSSMDSAKAVAILLANPSPINQYLNLFGPPPTMTKGCPLILAPTSSGTGSEVTKMCLVTYVEKNMKLPLYVTADLAILDPELCRTAPGGVTANGGLDALAHASEAVTCKFADPYSEVLALAAIKKIGKYLPRAVADGNDMEARSEMALASNWAGIAFSNTDVHIGHAGGDAIAAQYHSPHGWNVALMTPAVQELVARAVPDKVKLVGEALGIEFAEDETPEQIGKKVADKVRELMKACRVKGMKDFGYDRDIIINEGGAYIMKAPITGNSPYEMTLEDAKWLMQSAYDDYCAE